MKARMEWNPILECRDDETGQDTVWGTTIKYGKHRFFVWIEVSNEVDTRYKVTAGSPQDYKILELNNRPKSLTGAKRWVKENCEEIILKVLNNIEC